MEQTILGKLCNCARLSIFDAPYSLRTQYNVYDDLKKIKVTKAFPGADVFRRRSAFHELK